MAIFPDNLHPKGHRRRIRRRASAAAPVPHPSVEPARPVVLIATFQMELAPLRYCDTFL